MKYRLLLILAIAIIAGCNKDNPVSEDSESDKLLYQQIVGSWSFGAKTRFHYKSDRTWVDSAYTKYSDSSNYSLLCVVEGKYQIKNNILHYSDLHIKYADKYFAALVAEDVEISINGNEMSYQTVEVYSPLQQYQAQLFGSWTKTKWIVSKPTSSSQYYEGRQKDTYTFYSDSTYLDFKSEFLDQNSPDGFTYSVKYSYGNDILIKNEFDTLTVSFKNGQLYLYPKYSHSSLTRIR